MRTWNLCLALLGVSLLCGPAMAQSPAGGTTGPLSLSMLNQYEKETTYESTTVTTKDDEVAMEEMQKIDAYITLEDPQPEPEGTWSIEFSSGWDTRSDCGDEWNMEAELEFNPRNPECLKPMELSLSVPLVLGEGAEEGNGDLEFGILYKFWQEEDWIPTFALRSKMRIPSGYQSDGVDGEFTGILAHTLGPGVFFLNGTVATLNGNLDDDDRHFQWSIVPGYKLPVCDYCSLIFDYVHRSNAKEGGSNQHIFEMAAQMDVAKGVTFGPGIQVGLDGREDTPNFGAGFMLEYVF
jgi:hypothetical protein